jgi:hypothetical protein
MRRRRTDAGWRSGTLDIINDVDELRRQSRPALLRRPFGVSDEATSQLLKTSAGFMPPYIPSLALFLLIPNLIH